MLEIIIDRKNYKSFINYAIETCDYISMVFIKDDDDKTKYLLQDKYYMFSDYIISKTNIGFHPETNILLENCDLVEIKCDNTIKYIFYNAEDILRWNGEEYPGELCFYRGTDKWFTYISHEELSFIHNETEQDILFFEKEKIKYLFG